jgi:hypothetical protein
MTLNVDQAAVSCHIRHLDAAFRAVSFPWEISNIGAIEALHVVASRHDRKFAADLFRKLADQIENVGRKVP